MRTGIFVLIFGLIFSNLAAQTLDEYLVEAAENNPGLKASFAAFEASMERGAQAAQMPNPSLSFGYFILPVETRVGPQQAKLGLSQMFPWFGTLRANRDVASFVAESKYYAFIDARERLYTEVKTSYYSLYQIDRWVLLESENLELLESLLALTQAAYENSEGSLADVFRVEVEIDASKTRLALLEEKRKAAETAFNNFLNRDDGAQVSVSDSLPSEIADTLLAPESFIHHPQQQQLSEMSASAQAMENAARRRGYPSIGLGLDYVFVGKTEGSTAPNNGQDALMPMISLSLPIYRKGYNAARDEARKMQEVYQSQSEALGNELETKLKQAQYSRLEAIEHISLLGRQIGKTRSIVKLLESAYSNDHADFDEVLRAQRQLLDFEKKKVEAVVQLHTAQAQIDYLMVQGPNDTKRDDNE